MTVEEHLRAASGHVSGLRTSVADIREVLGTTVDVQRLRDDVARLADDLDLLARGAGIGAGGRTGAPGEIVFIPDTEYDPSLWADADDEGIGHPGR